MAISDLILGDNNAKPVEQVPSIADTILNIPKKEDIPKAVEQFNIEKLAATNRSAFVRGLRDVLDTATHGLARSTSAVADTILPEKLSGPIRRSKEELLTSDKAERDTYNTANPSEGILPTSAEVGRMTGQLIATAPLLPVRAFQAIRGAMGALPIAGKAAPFLNRATSSVLEGGLGGAEYGALTSSTNENSTAENVGEGLITGAIAGPVLTAAATVGQKALPTIRNMWANVQINKLAHNANMEPAVVKNIINILENSGLTPREAQLQLNKLGPQATLGDLASSIQNEVGGLASIGGKPAEILKGRYEARSKTANSSAQQLMEQKLGPKPDIEAEKEAIKSKVQKDVAPDYKLAHSNSTALDMQPVIDDIDKQLESAVGPKAAGLKVLKDYLFKTVKDTKGNDVKVLKYSVKDLHEVRQAIDDVLDKKSDPTSSYGKNAIRAIEKIRAGIDAELKSIPEMAAADTKFAAKMEILDHIKIGEDALKRGMNKEEFTRFFDNLSPEKQDAVKKGMRSAIGDAMEFASRGELSEAQRLFGKSSVNRANLEKAFGNKGTETLDALEKEAMFRSTENTARGGSQTAEKQSVQRKYGERSDGAGAGQIVHGAVLDLVTGTPGAATAIMTARRAGGHVKLKASEGRRERLIEGTADIISRQGTERNIGLDVINKANKINSRLKISANKLPIKELPVGLLAAPTGESGYSTYKKLGNE